MRNCGRSLHGRATSGHAFNPHIHTRASARSYEATLSFALSRGRPLSPERVAHLHDGLAIVETARFWDELPSGFTRIIRSTMMAPDPAFGQIGVTGQTFDGGSTGGAVTLDSRLLVDSQGNAIAADILENSGFRAGPDGGFVIIDSGGV